jgi:hypothetical protein
LLRQRPFKAYGTQAFLGGGGVVFVVFLHTGCGESRARARAFVAAIAPKCFLRRGAAGRRSSSPARHQRRVAAFFRWRCGGFDRRGPFGLDAGRVRRTGLVGDIQV